MAEKKKFIKIEIPLLKTEVEVHTGNIEKLENKTIKLDLTRMLRSKNLEAVFTIKNKNIKNHNSSTPIAIPKKLAIFPFFIRRAMRKSVNYVEDSFQAECKDAIIKIKPFLITRQKVSRAVRKTLRDKTKSLITKHIKDKKIEEILLEIINNKIQKTISLKLKKIYPLTLFEIKEIIIEKLKEKKKKK